MTIDDNLIDGKLQYDIKREAANIPALSSGKIDIYIYKYLTGEEILPYDQRRRIEQAKFTSSPFDETFENQIKIMAEHERKQVSKPEQNEQDLKSTEEIFPKKMRTNGIKYKIDKIKRWEEKIKRKVSKYEPKEHIYDFQQYETGWSFRDSICTRKASIVEAEEDQNQSIKIYSRI